MKATSAQKAACKRWYAKNKVSRIAAIRNYRQKHKKRLDNASKKWFQKNRGWQKSRRKQSRSSKADFISGMKLSNPCSDCKKYYEPCQMDFDHVFKKSFQIAAYLASEETKLFREISKCQLVCSNCHRLRTKERLCDYSM